MLKNQKYLATCKSLLFSLLLTFLSTPIFSEIDITTIDDWNIFSSTENVLIISKDGSIDTRQFLGFKMEQPWCVCKNPVIALKADEELEEGSSIKATIKVDLKRPMEVLLYAWLKLDSGYILFRPKSFPSFRSSSIIEVKSELGREVFLTKGIDNAMKSSEVMCRSGYLFEEVQKSETAFEMEV